MITYTKETGCFFQMSPDSKHYHLMEMVDYKGTKTSDIIAIWDFDNNALVGYHYGANTISVDELDHYVAEYVKEYEAKQEEQRRKPACVRYKFTKDGIRLFLNDSLAGIFEELDKEADGHPENYDFVVTCGNRSIRIPCGAEEYDGLGRWLQDAYEVNGDE